MRPPYPTITPAVTHRQARFALGRVLDWKPYPHPVGAADPLSLLLLLAARAASPFATARRSFPFSHEAASRAGKADLPPAGASSPGWPGPSRTWPGSPGRAAAAAGRWAGWGTTSKPATARDAQSPWQATLAGHNSR
jgi:hypothetical protein